MSNTREQRLQALLREANVATQSVRAGQHRSHEGEHSEAIFPTSSFVFESAAEAAARFAGTEAGNIYSRFTNPTVRTFEERLAVLEGGERCVAFASGMAAIMATMLALLKSGDHIISSRSIFGTTTVVFEKYLKKFGIETTFVDLADASAWAQAFKSNTRLLFLETPSNPLCEVADIRQLAELAHQHQCWLVVDNCYCTPALQQPLKLGADIVVHSATKYLDGQGRCVGGAVVGRDKEMQEVFGVLRTTGPSMSPFNAWVFLKGLETLSLRMTAHSQSGLAMAEWLQQQPGIDRVYYCGLPTHSHYALAQRQQRGFGGVLSFEVAGGQDAAWRFIDATVIHSITANLGDVKSTITHPATTTHGRLTEQERHAAGISSALIRISVGLEDLDDLKADLLRALAAL
ncbi:MAG TPA: O-succinylhomoserine sulfhydrylase [Pseudomonadales bacterium]|nr:O-succinylhomoserine sulfhydrylase [Pseudomonadales bacterium]